MYITRLTLGITEAEAAAAYGVTVRTYRGWEAGRRQRLNHDGIVRFAEKYDVSIDWIVSGEGFGLGPHMTKPAGNLAILPVMSAERRRLQILSIRRHWEGES
jgi:transcriptional regulator with XRE-family HTH domain